MNYPLVSIIIPYRVNRGYLSQAIESIHAQNYPGAIEIIQSNHDAGVPSLHRQALSIWSIDPAGNHLLFLVNLIVS